MSDPVSSMDVEDVLSSIRRLVSEEAKGSETAIDTVFDTGSSDIHEQTENAAEAAVSALTEKTHEIKSAFPGPEAVSDHSEISRPEASSGDPEMSFRHQAAQARAAADQRLVLTAALRVAVPNDLGEAPKGDDVSHRPHRPHLRSVSYIAETPVRPVAEPAHEPSLSENATLESPVEHKANRPEAESKHEARFDVAPDDTLFERARRAMQAVSEEPKAPSEFVFPSEAESKETESDVEAKVALEKSLSEALREPTTPDVPEDTETTGPEAPKPEAAEPEATEPEATEPETPAPETLAPEVAAPKMAELETAVSEPAASESAASESAEPEPALSETGSASPFSTGTGAFPEPTAEMPSTIDFTEEDESILDEDTLRDIVSEMVRSELQGELGDRITRNVRKLVRREIQRALASREFE